MNLSEKPMGTVEQGTQDALELLNAATSISTKFGEQEIAKEACKQLTMSLQADMCAISNWDKETDMVTVWTYYAVPIGDEIEYLSPYKLKDYPPTQDVLVNKRVTQMQVDESNIDEAERKILIDGGFQSLLMLPLLSQDEVLGLIEVFSKREKGIFSKAEIARAQLLASYTGVAVERARFIQKTQDRASKMLDAVATISRTRGAHAVAAEAAHQIIQLTGADSCSFSRWNISAHTVTHWGRYDKHGHDLPEIAATAFDLNKYPLTFEVLKTGKPAQVRVDDPDADTAEKQYLLDTNRKVVLLLPLTAPEGTIGLVEAYYDFELCDFTEEEISVVQLLARHAGIAIERAILFADAEQRAAELEALRQASLSVTAQLGLEDVLNEILESTLSLLKDALDSHIFLYDGDELNFGASLWVDGSRGEPKAQPRQDGLTYKVALEGRMITVGDMQNHPLYENAPKDWTGAILGMPLRIGEKVVGVMNVAYQYPRDFAEEELRVLSLLADQAAIAIENARLHDMVTQQALTDSLTGLPNRRAFDQHLEDEMRRSIRYQHRFVLLLLDFNGFKRVNDMYGHPAGDKTLHRIGKCIEASIRDTDFVARLGGDEFAVILPETEIQDAKKIIQKLHKAILECPFKWRQDKAEPIDLTLAVGSSSFPAEATNTSDLIEAADISLYEQKDEKYR